MPIDTKKAKEIQDDIASAEALIDQAQAYHDENKHLWTEAQAWDIQAEIDRARFDLEMSRRTVRTFQ